MTITYTILAGSIYRKEKGEIVEEGITSFGVARIKADQHDLVWVDDLDVSVYEIDKCSFRRVYTVPR